jgi:tRNA A37 methylthiotransferase MiaB
MSERKVLGKLGMLTHARTRRPELVLGVLGCMAELHGGELPRRAPQLDFVCGKDHGAGPDAFPALLHRLDAIAELRWLRFVTANPHDISVGMIAALAACEKVCPQIHFPLQSGSDRVLRRMHRRYSRADYFDKVARLRAAGAFCRAHDPHGRPVCTSAGTTDDAVWPDEPWMSLAINHFCTSSRAQPAHARHTII